MSGLLHINRLILPFSCIEYVYKGLREAGSHGVESIALWAGITSEDKFEVTHTIFPKQTGYKIEMGLLYSVDGDELHRINVWLYENKKTLVAQIHSHPNEAYHSETDDKYPIIAFIGGLSIVIPDFGFREFSLTDWAVFRLSKKLDWDRLNETEVQSLIQIVY